MSGGFTVRRWSAAERLDEIMAMIHASFAEFQPPSGVLSETVADLAKRQRDGLVLVAQAGDDLIGSVFAAPKDNALYLTRMAVLPAWRKRGVGHALMQAAEAEARALGLARLSLRVRQTLPANRAYFEGQGFLVIGEGQDPGRTPYFMMHGPMLKPRSQPAG